MSYEGLQATCPATPVAGTTRVATIDATGVSWAIARLTYTPGNCKIYTVPLAGQTAKQVSGPDKLEPFANPETSVFERANGGPWYMTSQGGKPFPCPAPGGVAPGEGNGAIPKNVLDAWHMPYASNCADVVYPTNTGGSRR